MCLLIENFDKDKALLSCRDLNCINLNEQNQEIRIGTARKFVDLFCGISRHVYVCSVYYLEVSRVAQSV
jgi:hypothetical protein